MRVERHKVKMGQDWMVWDAIIVMVIPVSDARSNSLGLEGFMEESFIVNR